MASRVWVREWIVASSTVISTKVASEIAPSYSTMPHLVDNTVQVLISVGVLIVTSSLLLFYSLLGIYIDCRDAYEQGQTQSGVYTIQPDSEPAFQAYCDMTTDGGGWTVFQRRQDGSQDFFLYWTDYENGFGDLSNEFWLGLAQMHRLTASTARTELRVDLEDASSNTGYAQYADFGIGDASSNYVITVAGHSGTALDLLTHHHNNQSFSTRDRDNDNHSGNCAELNMAGWWYNQCIQSDLNSRYRWLQWNGLQIFSEMKLRRA